MQKLLDLIVNEETEKANELFHEIVVERSREIYENLIAEEEEEEMDESSEEDDEEMDESTEDEDEDLEEGFGMDDDADDELGGDPADAMVGDTEVGDDDMDSMDPMGGEDGSEPATKNDVQDLEDALAELKAEFEALMGGEGGDEEFGDEEADDSEADEFGDEEADDAENDDEEADDEEDDENMGMVREYRETVGNDWDKNSQKEQGKNLGAGSGEN